MSHSELLEPFERLLVDIASAGHIRSIEAGESADGLWERLEESGFLDAMVGEDQGGAGLSLAEAGPLLRASGRHVLPAPFAETLLARALLAAAGSARPAGPVVLVTPGQASGGYRRGAVPCARDAKHALVDLGTQVVLSPLSAACVTSTGVHGSLAADLTWRSVPEGTPVPGLNGGSLRGVAAVAHAAQIAGAADRLLELTVRHAGERKQFGKPVAAFQAVQQQLAIMAEQTVLARIAAEIGCARGLPPPPEAAATAKQVTGAAATVICAIAHGVHGAIGISEEYDLQLYVRRLYEWRLAEGSETYWAGRLGARRLASDVPGSVDFVREMFGGARNDAAPPSLP